MNANAASYVPPSSSQEIVGKALQQGEASQRKGGKRKGKQNQQKANHLAGFHSKKSDQRSQGGGRAADRGRHQHKSHKKFTAPTPFHSKDHFLATNYRYVVASYANFIQNGFFEPDVMISWEDIQLVVATVDKDTSAESCSICLEESIILPQITKCGHIFCLICLLRYLESEYSKKCPVCSGCNVCRNDLRDVLFVATPPPLVQSKTTFSLLSKDKSSLFPICHDSRSSSLLSCPDVQLFLQNKKGEKAKFEEVSCAEAVAVGVPEIDSKDSQYSRICYSSAQKLIRYVNQSLKSLDNFRKVCVASGSTEHALESRGDVEYLSVIPEASALLSARKETIKSQNEKKYLSPITLPPNPRPLTSSTSTSESSAVAPIWLYQHQAGHISFLHPLCMRALLYQQSVAQSLGSSEEQSSEKLESLTDIDIRMEGLKISNPSQSSDEKLPLPEPPATTSRIEQEVNGLPSQVSGRVVDIERCSVTPDQRKRYPFIRHLPLDCEFSLVEIDMKPSLTVAVYDHFKDQFQKREVERKSRRNKQLKEMKRDKQKQIHQEEKLIATRREIQQHHETEKNNAILSLLTSPPVGSIDSSAGVEVGEFYHPENHVVDSSQVEVQTNESNSFAKITELGVSNEEAFPTLGGGGGAGKSGVRSVAPLTTCGSSTAPAWGAKAKGLPGGVGGEDRMESGNKANSQKKKGKNKFVSSSALFATSSTRSYR